jgi:hypothetical protein
MHAWALCFRNNAPALYSKSKRTVCKGAAISLATPLVSLIHFLPSLRLLRNAETGSSANRPDNSIHRGLESRFLAQTRYRGAKADLRTWVATLPTVRRPVSPWPPSPTRTFLYDFHPSRRPRLEASRLDLAAGIRISTYRAAERNLKDIASYT